jgi:hypothetical protein
MPTYQQIERLNKRHSEAALESERPLNKRKRQGTTPSGTESEDSHPYLPPTYATVDRLNN